MSVDTATATSWTVAAPRTAAENTHASVVTALKRLTTLADKQLETFLQGSYANHTNVRSDSDVDLVVMSRKTFYHNINDLSPLERQQFHNTYSNSIYGATELRTDIYQALVDYYNKELVEPHNKCIRVLARDGYLDADVVPAFIYRHYNSFSPLYTGDYVEGAIIFPADGSPRIINFPKEHIKHGTRKHQATSELFKPTVRQLKQLKHKAIADRLLLPKKLPGYLLECMTYNVPHFAYVPHDLQRMANILAWLDEADFSSFNSVDNVHRLFLTDPGKFDIGEAKRAISSLKMAFVS